MPHTYQPLTALNFVKNTAICHSIRQRHTIDSLEKNTEVYFSNNYMFFITQLRMGEVLVYYIQSLESCTV